MTEENRGQYIVILEYINEGKVKESEFFKKIKIQQLIEWLSKVLYML